MWKRRGACRASNVALHRKCMPAARRHAGRRAVPAEGPFAGPPPEMVARLGGAIAKTMQDPALRETRARQNMGEGYLDEAAFKGVIVRDKATFKALIEKLEIKT